MPIEEKEGIQVDVIALGEIGREGNAHMEKVNNDIAGFIPVLEKYFESGALKPMDYDFIEGTNFEPVLQGLEAFKTKTSGEKKLLVRIAAD